MSVSPIKAQPPATAAGGQQTGAGPSKMDPAPEPPRQAKEGCGIDMDVLGIKLKHHEKSRASKVNCINHKVPNQCLNLLKTDAERRASVQKYQSQKQSKDGNKGSFYDNKEKEFQDILRKIERVRNHKLEAAGFHVDSNSAAQGGGDDTRKATNNISKQVKQAQKEIDQRRNASQGSNQARSATAAKRLGTAGTHGQSGEAMDIDGAMADANLNLIEFLSMKPADPEDLKFQRVVTSQGAGTFEDIKQNLEQFQRLGKVSVEERTMSRQRRKQLHDLVRQGKEVGAYSPQYTLLEQRGTASNFDGPRGFLSERRRTQLQRRLQRSKDQIAYQNDETKEVDVTSTMKRRRQIRQKIKQLEPSKRPDPFEPAQSYYYERVHQGVLPPEAKKCKNCFKYQKVLGQPSQQRLMQLTANWKFQSRVDSHIQDMGKHCPHNSITDGYFTVTDSRFETNMGSTFLGGEIMHSSPVQSRIQRNNQNRKALSSFNPRTSHFSSNYSRSISYGQDDSYSDANYSGLIGAKRPMVPSLANVPTVKIGAYAKRNPATLFYPQGKAPISSDTEGHGGVFYSTEFHMPFERKVESKKDQMKRIEQVTRKAKSGLKQASKYAKKQMARENAEMLFNLLHGDGAQKVKSARSKSMITSLSPIQTDQLAMDRIGREDSRMTQL